MLEFDKLCKSFEELDPATYTELLTEKSVQLIPVLETISIDNMNGVALYATFILASIAADGKLDESEYLLMKPMLDSFFGAEFSYDTCKNLIKGFKNEGKALKKIADDMVDLLGELSIELKADVITICFLITSVDGKINLKERQWIKQLIK